MGIPIVRTKLMAYGTGAAFGGISGAFLGSYLNTVNADQFQFSFSIFILAMVILGGLGSIWGVVLGAVALSFINSYLIPDVLNGIPRDIGLDFDLTQLSYGIFGFLLVIMMVLRPAGLLPERRRKLEMHGVGAGETAGAGTDVELHEERAAMSALLLTTDSVSKRFGGLVAVDGLDFELAEGQIASVIGPNGAGKTTFFNMLTGLYRPTTGSISYEGREISRARPDRITAMGIARTFQNIRLFPTMSALENVMIGQHARMRAGLFGSILRPPRVRAEERRVRETAREMLGYAGLAERCSSRSRRTSPTATSAGSRSPGRSPPSPACCCSTSRPRG